MTECNHKWKVIGSFHEGSPSYSGTYTTVYLRCEKCGWIGDKEVNGKLQIENETD